MPPTSMTHNQKAGAEDDGGEGRSGEKKGEEGRGTRGIIGRVLNPMGREEGQGNRACPEPQVS